MAAKFYFELNFKFVTFYTNTRSRNQDQNFGSEFSFSKRIGKDKNSSLTHRFIQEAVFYVDLGWI
jgi:hypothetical protein